MSTGTLATAHVPNAATEKLKIGTEPLGRLIGGILLVFARKALKLDNVRTQDLRTRSLVSSSDQRIRFLVLFGFPTNFSTILIKTCRYYRDWQQNQGNECKFLHRGRIICCQLCDFYFSFVGSNGALVTVGSHKLSSCPLVSSLVATHVFFTVPGELWSKASARSSKSSISSIITAKSPAKSSICLRMSLAWSFSRLSAPLVASLTKKPRRFWRTQRLFLTRMTFSCRDSIRKAILRRSWACIASQGPSSSSSSSSLSSKGSTYGFVCLMPTCCNHNPLGPWRPRLTRSERHIFVS
ncbi:hypothetical protein CGRA01v4_05038 [Colletotrichum graminicola]|nr:hypothetical protein CGRA01v4_05038 [Colletotrichum graminicola]